MTAASAAGLLVAGLLALATAGCAAPDQPPGAAGRAGPVGAPEGPWAQQYHWLPVAEAGGTTRLILARACRPPGAGAHRLVVINHGKSPSSAEIAAFVPPGCDAEPVRWFLARGFAVLLPVRRGYGATGGAMAEHYPPCGPGRDYAAGARETARDIGAAIDYATTLPGIAGRQVVVVGQSAGGLGTIALAGRNDPRVAELVSMAGGDGGHLNRVADAVCQPQALVRAVARFGATARTPMLWVYTANDSYFPPGLAADMYRAYTAAGAPARLASLPPWGTDGHLLFTSRGGSAIWGPLVEAFLGLRATAAAGSALARH